MMGTGTGADGVHERLRLPATEAAPRLARRRVAEFCRELGEDIAMAAELLTSELVTNAVIHPRPSATAHSDLAAIVLQMHRTPDRVRVEVIDHDPEPLQPAGPAEDLSHGWGLQLLDRLATSWGAQPLAVEVGKTVWFEIHAAADR